MQKINVALVGLQFGGAFVKIYRDHPNVGEFGIYDIDGVRKLEVSENAGVGKLYASFDEILCDKNVDAVHLVTPIPLHEEQTIAVLESGKHCACTVPMALTTDGIRRIAETTRKTGRNFMMMETTLYTYQFYYVNELIRQGKIGKIQFMRGSHYQDMANWPDYWMGLPPMHYGTHAIGPMVALSGSRISV